MQSIPCAYTRAPTFPSFCDSKTTVLSSRFDENGPLFASLQAPESVQPGGAAAAADAAPGGAAAGLVYSQTSGTSAEKPIRIDREASRLKRLRCSVLTAARLHVQEKSRWKVAMLTLTYRPDVDWAPGQISTVVRHIRQWLARKGHEMRFVWVQEFTKKGRPHYHLLLWLPLGLTIPKPDKQRWWPWGMTKIEWARNAVGYIAKYASKGDALHQPAKGARMHGNGGLTGGALIEQRWWKLPGWLRDRVEPSDGVRRAPAGTGGGFINPDSGEVYRSPWAVFFKGGFVFIERRAGV
jgi:hypothetical protein